MDWETKNQRDKELALKEILALWDTNVERWSTEMNVRIGEGISRTLNGISMPKRR